MATDGINVYQYGNTIRFVCRFYDFNNKLVDPQLIKIIIYNNKYEQIITEILGNNNRADIGSYFYDYITDNKTQRLYYEWYGEINGKPSLKRKAFVTKFLK